MAGNCPFFDKRGGDGIPGEELEKRLKAYKLGWDDLSADEKRAVERALRVAVDPSSIVGIVLARSRTLRRQSSDRVTDKNRRILVGARVPREFASRCRVCAKQTEKSLYRFVFDALTRECEKVEKTATVDNSVEKPVERE